MKRFSLGPDGPTVSEMAYGVWRLDQDPDGAGVSQVRAKIDVCLEAGITTFDHAAIYGEYTCEGYFGQALKEAPELRDHMEIVTKCGIYVPSDKMPGSTLEHYDASAARIEESVDRSLRELCVDHIDVLLIHRPDWLTNADDTALGLLNAMSAGKVGSVGVSNYSVHQANLLAHYLGKPLVTNQVEIHLLHMEAIYDGTLDHCQLNGAHPMAWSPLAGGRLLTGDGIAETRTRDALTQIGKEYDATADQIALAWVQALPCRPQAVIGTNNLDRIRAASASTRITLTRQHWYALWTAAMGQGVP